MVEVMISVAILATVLTVMAANIGTLSMVREDAKEEAIVQEVLNGVVERIQGDTLSNLGQLNENVSHLNAWSWHRRISPRWPNTNPVNKPMTEVWPKDAYGKDLPVPTLATVDSAKPFANYLLPVYDNSTPPQLISPGLLAQRSGVKDLSVYLEYYRQDVMLTELMSATDPHKTWVNICNSSGDYNGRNDLVYTDEIEGDTRLNFGNEATAAVLIRVIVTWTAHDGGNRSRELTLARRQ